MKLSTCVTAEGCFSYGVHRPRFKADNFRCHGAVESLGITVDGVSVDNSANYPDGAVTEKGADWVYEIPNAFPFRGVTYIARRWALEKSRNPGLIFLPQPPRVSLSQTLKEFVVETGTSCDTALLFKKLPEPMLLALAVTSTDSCDLVQLADIACRFQYDALTGVPLGLLYHNNKCGQANAVIRHPALFEAVANNRHLPAAYKKAMVLRPGVQGGSQIVGESMAPETGSHIFEYLRRNSYIPWGHYAANMADDTICYRIGDLTRKDIIGMRHLYYQRTYSRLARTMGVALGDSDCTMSIVDLEQLRLKIRAKLLKSDESKPFYTATLWGWNFGFDLASSHYRLHASHQQIHQQYGLIPGGVESCNSHTTCNDNGGYPAYSAGDLVASFGADFKEETGKPFFECYLAAIRSNRRMDDNAEGEHSLVVYEDERVMIFVPKAQTSQWEIQLMTLLPVGNIIEADTAMRRSIDDAILIAQRILESLGACMVTTIEYSKRITDDRKDQRLIYAFLPRLPESPGAFSEAQLRWVNGHYPEDFAHACRCKLIEAQTAIQKRSI